MAFSTNAVHLCYCSPCSPTTPSFCRRPSCIILLATHRRVSPMRRCVNHIVIGSGVFFAFFIIIMYFHFCFLIRQICYCSSCNRSWICCFLRFCIRITKIIFGMAFVLFWFFYGRKLLTDTKGVIKFME